MHPFIAAALSTQLIRERTRLVSPLGPTARDAATDTQRERVRRRR